MADGFLGFQSPGTSDKKLDTEELTVGTNTVERERVVIAGTGATEVAAVKATTPAAGANGLVTRTVSKVAGTFITGRKSCDESATVQIIATSTPLQFGVTVKAHSQNPCRVYVGLSTETPGTVEATDGYPLEEGEAVFIPVDNANKVYVIAEEAQTCNVSWIGA